MDWVTTNIRFTEDQYMDLKLEAAKKRKSVAFLIRQKLFKKNTPGSPKAALLLKRTAKLAKKISQQNKGISLSEELVKMRYEQ